MVWPVLQHVNTVGLLPLSKLIQKLDNQLHQTTDLFLHRLSLFVSFLGNRFNFWCRSDHIFVTVKQKDLLLVGGVLVQLSKTHLEKINNWTKDKLQHCLNNLSHKLAVTSVWVCVLPKVKTSTQQKRQNNTSQK